MSAKDDFLATRALLVSPEINLPGRSKPCYVRELAGSERRALDQKRYLVDGRGTLRLDTHNDDIHWVTACVCDAAGARIFEDDWKDPKTLAVALAQVSRLPDPELNELAKEAVRMNAYGASDVRDAAKKLQASPISCLPIGWLVNTTTSTWPTCWPS